ncbi:methyltransferase domain-containing protein [bacterium]|nr:methyltransferase domain-containing protein [bacterium]
MKQYLTFLKEFGANRDTVGSVIPATSQLGDALSKLLTSSRTTPASVLEVGPGTGTITKRILSKMRRGDELVLVEVNPQFCEILENLARTEWKEDLEGVHFSIECCVMEDLEKDKKYDYIISSLPLNNFCHREVRAILESYQNLLNPGGKLSYYEYLYVREIQKKLSHLRNNEDRLSTYALLEDFIQNYQVESDDIYLNFPPAVARHFSFQRRPRISRAVTRQKPTEGIMKGSS